MTKTRDQELVVYLSQDELDAVKKAAKADDRSASRWALYAVLDRLGRKRPGK